MARGAIFLPLSQLARIGKWREDDHTAMSRYRQQHNQASAKPRRRQFADGSAVMTYPDGSQLILGSALAKSGVLCEGRPVNYNEPLRRVAIGKTRRGRVAREYPHLKSSTAEKVAGFNKERPAETG